MPIDPPRTEFLGLPFDQLSIDELVALLGNVAAGEPFRFMVTPNVDHLVRMDGDDVEANRLRDLYRGADVCVCDSRVLAGIASVCGLRMTVAPGSDVVARLFGDVIKVGDTVSIVGGDKALLAGLRAMRPDTIFTQHCPPMGLRDNPQAIFDAARFVAESGARFHLLAVGSPQQEMVAIAARSIAGASGMALCIGAGLEFLTGARSRAPGWMRSMGLEWLHRLMSEPRRMWRRYLVDGPRIFSMALRWRIGLTRASQT